MIYGGANRICFVIAPGKSDILSYFGAGMNGATFAYVVQPRPAGLCDSLFRALPLITPDEQVIFGLPDTIWFPEDALRALPDGVLSFLTFPVEHPEFFDAVVTDNRNNVLEIQVKTKMARSNWIWGAFKMPGCVLQGLHDLWQKRNQRDEYLGTLVNEYLARGGHAVAVNAGERYVDIGTLNGYRNAIQLLSSGHTQPSQIYDSVEP